MDELRLVSTMLLCVVLIGFFAGSVNGWFFLPPPPPRPPPMTNVEKCFGSRRPCGITAGSWFVEGGTCFYVNKDLLSVSEAKTACENLVAGGHLANINDGLQNRGLAVALDRFGIDSAIFGYQYHDNNIFAYDENAFAPMTTTGTLGGCVQMDATGEWSTSDCATTQRAFICEKPANILGPQGK
ncbi:uncharacterized protein LOC141910577 [Tubulanus polymorphus]|uniref:uncharacterized protein LOC141910577 n=1 Tax=Tubulanus polymorphus TaxID=672921 RepID=UPI003DA2AA6A